jgi:4-diphosphocytidyl-2-C-methyl-D-erythritol kinase
MLFRWDQSSLVVHAPAKLNLFLEVLNKRPDGFHELETVMVMLGIYDTLRFSPVTDSTTDTPQSAIEFRLYSADPRKTDGEQQTPVPAGRDNLVVKAAELLRSHAGYEGGARIDLWKRIPSEAGMAGGSSDAAATLAGLSRLWKLKLSIEELQQLAARLGSDVPFFLSSSRSALCRGRGEIVEPLNLALGHYFVVVRPPSGLSTPKVFREWQPTEQRRSANRLIEALRRGDSASLAEGFHNALQKPAEKLNADVSRLRDAFSKEPVLGHMMSGSGTAYFGVARHRRHAEYVAARLSSRRIGCVLVARSLL